MDLCYNRTKYVHGPAALADGTRPAEPLRQADKLAYRNEANDAAEKTTLVIRNQEPQAVVTASSMAACFHLLQLLRPAPPRRLSHPPREQRGGRRDEDKAYDTCRAEN